jgi:hypothetical protein
VAPAPLAEHFALLRDIITQVRGEKPG